MANETRVDAGGQISGNVLFYSKPEPLSPELHKGLGVQRMDGPFGCDFSGHMGWCCESATPMPLDAQLTRSGTV